MFIARFNDIEIQCLKEHLTNVSIICKEISMFPKSCELVGLLHDIGKYSMEFQDYIKEGKIQKEQGSYDNWIKKVKKVDHGVYGAKLLIEKYKNTYYFKLSH